MPPGRKALVMTLAGVCVLSLAAPGPGADEAEAGWTTSAGLNLSLTRGNSKTLVVGINVASSLKSGANECRLDLEANYGETEVENEEDGTTEDEATVENAKLTGEGRRLFGKRLYGSFNASALTDNIAEIDHRVVVGPGLGYYVVKNDSVQLGADLGPSWITEDVAGETDDVIAIRAAERLEVTLSKTAKFWQSVEVLPTAGDDDDYLVNSELGVEAAMNSRLSLRVVLRQAFDSTPAEEKEKEDLSLITGLTFRL